MPGGQEAAAGKTQKFVPKLLGRFDFLPLLFFSLFFVLWGFRGFAVFRAKPFETQAFGFTRDFFSMSFSFVFPCFSLFFLACFFAFLVAGVFATVRGKPFETQGFGFAGDFFSISFSFAFVGFAAVFLCALAVSFHQRRLVLVRL